MSEADINTRYRIEPLNKEHDRTHFDCGHPFLNSYLEQFVRQNDRKGLARAYVLIPEPEGNPVVGYYTLSAGQVIFDDIPPELRKALPQYPLPVARIGELAVDRHAWGKGLGTDLLFDAIARIDMASQQVAVWAIVVEPIDQRAMTFYFRHGFQAMPTSDTLILPMKHARAFIQ